MLAPAAQPGQLAPDPVLPHRPPALAGQVPLLASDLRLQGHLVGLPIERATAVGGLSHIAVQAQPAGRTGRLDPGGRHRIDHLRIPLGVGGRAFPPHTDLARGATRVWIRSLESEGSDPRHMQETVRDFDVLREGEPVCRTVFRFETGILFGPLQQCCVGISPILERVPHFSQAVGLQPGLLISPPQGGEFLAQAEATDTGPGAHPIVPPTAIGFLRAGQAVVPDKAAGSRRPCQLLGPGPGSGPQPQPPGADCRACCVGVGGGWM